MERRNRSLEALDSLYYIDSLDGGDERALSLERWLEKYLQDDFEKSFDLELEKLIQLSELFYKNINFLKKHKENIKQELEDYNNIKKFLH
jgi:hypothetical protein